MDTPSPDHDPLMDYDSDDDVLMDYCTGCGVEVDEEELWHAISLFEDEDKFLCSRCREAYELLCAAEPSPELADRLTAASAHEQKIGAALTGDPAQDFAALRSIVELNNRYDCNFHSLRSIAYGAHYPSGPRAAGPYSYADEAMMAKLETWYEQVRCLLHDAEKEADWIRHRRPVPCTKCGDEVPWNKLWRFPYGSTEYEGYPLQRPERVLCGECTEDDASCYRCGATDIPGFAQLVEFYGSDYLAPNEINIPTMFCSACEDTRALMHAQQPSER
jgi:hypothetical protein